MSFILGKSLYKQGVWARMTALLSRKPMMGRLGDLYPMETAKGFHLVFFHVLTSGTGGKANIANLFV
jgi:hypothetical protein